jgi:hypothetical protein
LVDGKKGLTLPFVYAKAGGLSEMEASAAIYEMDRIELLSIIIR